MVARLRHRLLNEMNVIGAGMLYYSLTAAGKKLYLYAEVFAYGVMKQTASSPLMTAGSRYWLVSMSTRLLMILWSMLTWA